MIKEDEPPPPSTGVAGVVGGVPGGVPGGAMGGVLGGIISNAPAVVPKAATPQRVRVSQGVSQGLLIQAGEAELSAAGAPGAYSGDGGAAGVDQQGRFHSRTCTWSADTRCWPRRRSMP